MADDQERIDNMEDQEEVTDDSTDDEVTDKKIGNSQRCTCIQFIHINIHYRLVLMAIISGLPIL